MGSLVKNSMVEHNTRIGFNSKIERSYFAGNDKIFHYNVILDTIVGQNVWFGGYSGTADVILERRNLQYEVNDNLWTVEQFVLDL
jgi:bifunctional UDP-N-acetylglucosamine pyrophosphorylase/glucosamine-1-phosphate N-acetyltransferase